jgi:hypothetical protein
MSWDRTHSSLIKSLEDIKVEIETVVEEGPVDVGEGGPGQSDHRRVDEAFFVIDDPRSHTEVVEVEEVGVDRLEGGVNRSLV